MSRTGTVSGELWAVRADGTLGESLAACLEAATAAPSIHNTQPWRLRVRRTCVDVLADRQRQLPVIDPAGREMMISLGAAILNLRLAMLAHGRLPLLRLLPDRGERDLVARITVGQPIEPRRTVRALAEAIPRRHTNRLPFANRPVPEAVVAELTAAASAEGAMLGVAGAVGRDAILMLAGTAERAQRSDRRYLRELTDWTQAVPAGRRDGVPGGALGPRDERLALPLRDFDPDAMDTPSTPFEPHPVIATLSTVADGAEQWLRAGQSLQRVLLTATVRGLSATPLSQATEIPEVRTLLASGNGHRAVQVILRLGYGQPVVGTPRRPLSEVLVPASPHVSAEAQA